MTQRTTFTSESVSEGHPDKLADQVSDAVLDACLTNDPEARVACETFTTTGMVLVGGEITTSTYVDLQEIVRGVARNIGYNNPDFGLDYQSMSVMNVIHSQSPDIGQGVDTGGAGDQGMMFGFACSETPHLMPAPITFAHALLRRASELRKAGTIAWLRPDAKSQVTVVYEGHRPVAIDTVVLSHQHHPDVSQATIEDVLVNHLIKPVLEPSGLLGTDTKYFINPTGRFVIGGPHGDAGLTGRKIIVDTYGGMGRHGGGAFSGKDPTKVDRSAAYMARYAAKNIVAAGWAERAEIQVSYAIGVDHPVSFLVQTFGTGKVAEDKIAAAVAQVFDFSPRGIISTLGLRRPLYAATAAYGHFGREGFPWEATDKVEALQRALG